MFTIPVAACVVGFCSVVFGTVDWRAPHDERCFYFRSGLHFCLEGAPIENKKASAELKTIIGKKTVVCSVTFMNGRVKNHFGKCYLEGAPTINVADEMQKRGF